MAHREVPGFYDGRHSKFDRLTGVAQQDVKPAVSRHSEVEQALDQAQQMLDVALSSYRTRLDYSPPAAEFHSSEEKLEPILEWFVRRSHSRPVRLRTVWSRRPKIEMRPALLHHLYRRSGGSTVQALSAPEAVLSPESSPALDGLDTRHAEIRVSQRKLPDLTIMDGQVAILRTTTTYGQPRIFVVQYPEIVRGFSALYDVVWAEGVELHKFRPHGIEPDNEMTAKVLTLLGNGCRDETAARQLGLSVRTYRRHVADLMTRLNVTCRFQAGVQAVRLGLIGDGLGIRSRQPA
jgi:DNA-binding CsgD family transcriptional regulator